MNVTVSVGGAEAGGCRVYIEKDCGSAGVYDSKGKLLGDRKIQIIHSEWHKERSACERAYKKIVRRCTPKKRRSK